MAKKTNLTEAPTVDQLEARVAELETIVRLMAEEVRTKRVVVEDDGFERVVLETGTTRGNGLHVIARADAGAEESRISLVVDDHDGDGPESAELWVWGAGEPLVTLSGRRRWNWRAEEPESDPTSGKPTFDAELHLERPYGRCGMVFDADGVRPHPIRLHEEECYRQAEFKRYRK